MAAPMFYGFDESMQSVAAMAAVAAASTPGQHREPQGYYFQPAQPPVQAAPPVYPQSSAMHDQPQSYHGYPGADTELEQFCRQLHSVVPDAVVRFIVLMHRAISVGNVDEILCHYESGFPHLTEQFYSNSPWPAPDVIKPIVKDDVVFLMLYQELYHRHLLAKVPNGPSLDDRFQSYLNYIALFQYLLTSETPVTLKLPNQWLWDIIDEFLYQFQSYIIYKNKPIKRSAEEQLQIVENVKLWNVHAVLNVLTIFIEKSRTAEQLQAVAENRDPATVAGEFGQVEFYRLLGMFSLVGLVRLHIQIGDYCSGLRVLDCMNMNKRSIYDFTGVPMAQITLLYYVGFAYMMMRRYRDAISTFASLLSFVQRSKQMFPNRSQLYDQDTKTADKGLSLLALCHILCPVPIDDSILQQVREKVGSADRLARLQKGDLDEFEQCFLSACPKFLSPAPPSFDRASTSSFPATEERPKEPYTHQLQMFLQEVEQVKASIIIRNYLKLYTSIPIAKLASLLQTDAAALKATLMTLKHKTQNVTWDGTRGALSGSFQPAPLPIDFAVDGDVVIVKDVKVSARHSTDYFVTATAKLSETIRVLKGVLSAQVGSSAAGKGAAGH